MDKYVAAELEIIKFDAEDVITTSCASAASDDELCLAN